ncbi:MAG: hypothetical protein EPN85_08585 [Bacteroidetes bacterium]|nr:MAG: hypothetical protein EPN85_08585 [Bacteroidota bacterium]
MGFKNFLREYFTFNRRERNGVFILLAVILAVILYLSFSDFFSSRKKTDFSKFEKEVAQFEAEQNQSVDSVLSEAKNNFKSPDSTDSNNSERFLFNPNTLPEDDWKRLGLSDKQIKVIKSYESKGGKFKSKEDVKKMYCISPKLFASFEQYIQIPADTYRKVTKAPLSLWKGAGGGTVELNSADTTDIISLKGIGPSFAKRIIKYREILGGFIKKEQLLEVYGLDKEKYNLFSSAVIVDDSKVKKININTVTFEELKKHPYIKYNIANLIINYRKQHGNYVSVEDIKQLDLVNDELFAKIASYLTVQ